VARVRSCGSSVASEARGTCFVHDGRSSDELDEVAGQGSLCRIAGDFDSQDLYMCLEARPWT
jgi:hypothetical protein